MLISFTGSVRNRLGALALGLLAVGAAWSQTVLPSLPGLSTYPLAVNNSGLVVGNAYGNEQGIRAVRWVDGQILSLDGFTYSRATGVNDAGVIVGGGWATAESRPEPVVWIDGVASVLPTLGHGGMAQDINAAGEIAGWVDTDSFTAPAVWRNGELTVLGSLRENGGEAAAIDQAGRIVGFSRGYDGDQLPTLWSGDQITALPVSYGESYLGVIGVNKSGGGRTSGFVVQRRFLDDGSPYSVVVAVGWQDDGYRELQRLNDTGNSYAHDVNGNGVYVGYATDAEGAYAPTLWTDEGVSRLPYEAGRAALAIGANESGQVVGVDYSDPFNPIPLLWDLSGEARIAMPNRVAARGEALTLEATVLRKGKPVAGRKVRFEAQGQAIGEATTNAQGVASLAYQVPAQARGAIRLKISAGGSSYAVRQVEIRRANTAAGVTPSQAQRGKTTTLRASLRSSELNQPLAGREVSFVLDGLTVGSARTNDKGLATLRYRLPKDAALGTRELSARYAGDEATRAVQARATLAVLR